MSFPLRHNMDQNRVEEVYAKILPQLTKTQFGKIVAIEPESGDYFVGETMGLALEKAEAKYPTKPFFFKRVGAKAAIFIGGGLL